MGVLGDLADQGLAVALGHPIGGFDLLLGLEKSREAPPRGLRDWSADGIICRLTNDRSFVNRLGGSLGSINWA